VEAQAEVGQTTAFKILAAISVCHLLNDTLSSLLPSIYPLLKSSFHLDFAEVGLITLTYQLTASVLQPLVGLHADLRPRPYSLTLGMGLTLIGLLTLSMARSFSAILVAAALVGMILLATVGSWAKEYRANKTKSRALHSERHPVLTTRRAGAPGLL
jgi:FSR family fosmidomycin resistance protein-like MFS transporter